MPRPAPARPRLPAPALRAALRGLTLAIAATSLLALAPGAQGASKNKKAASATHAPAKKRSTRVKPSQNHSGESTAEREKRLYRECQGMPNAGACLGYAKR
ncbi:hypothetical protein [Comamonas sp. NLF-1-9]|uniref:hypothetical protein n=1 Tax=Comamonas sp. NLF-1-9 TaxID=2853163 RepID=UPI001C45A556|nr:hypothetical protein [Comamonas sp. NLF-1-9]QXL85951.1 hypothetical protein KUD94_01780 [Comamonas sp. NLF-1-9]